MLLFWLGSRADAIVSSRRNLTNLFRRCRTGFLSSLLVFKSVASTCYSALRQRYSLEYLHTFILQLLQSSCRNPTVPCLKLQDKVWGCWAHGVGRLLESPDPSGTTLFTVSSTSEVISLHTRFEFRRTDRGSLQWLSWLGTPRIERRLWVYASF